MSELFLAVIKSLVAAMAAMMPPGKVMAVIDGAFDAVRRCIT